ncbi:MAG: hypothetical protein H5T44_00040 [Thermoplasmatales archaeon]|nr:hypothetical protein [Thermoplasmatales archaeon]
MVYEVNEREEAMKLLKHAMKEIKNIKEKRYEALSLANIANKKRYFDLLKKHFGLTMKEKIVMKGFCSMAKIASFMENLGNAGRY